MKKRYFTPHQFLRKSSFYKVKSTKRLLFHFSEQAAPASLSPLPTSGKLYFSPGSIISLF